MLGTDRLDDKVDDLRERRLHGQRNFVWQDRLLSLSAEWLLWLGTACLKKIEWMNCVYTVTGAGDRKRVPSVSEADQKGGSAVAMNGCQCFIQASVVM